MYPSSSKKKHVFICNGSDCKKNGSQNTIKEIKKSLKAQEIKSFRIVKTKCMDYCKLGPNVACESLLFHKCNAEDAQALIQALLKA